MVDDGSTDDLVDALGPFGRRIRLLRKDNGGAASAMNLGASVATGDFLARLDADDVYKPRMLEALRDLASSRPELDLLTTDAYFVVNGDVVGRYRDRVPFPVGSQRQAILSSCFPGGWAAVRLARLHEIGGFDESLRTGEDWDCWVRLILGGSVVGCVEEPLLEYRLREGSLTASRVSSLWDRARILEKAAHNPSLGPEERPVMLRLLRYNRTRAVIAQAQGMSIRGWRSRAELLKLASTEGIAARVRAALVASAVAARLRDAWLPRDAGPLIGRPVDPETDLP